MGASPVLSQVKPAARATRFAQADNCAMTLLVTAAAAYGAISPFHPARDLAVVEVASLQAAALRLDQVLWANRATMDRELLDLPLPASLPLSASL